MEKETNFTDESKIGALKKDNVCLINELEQLSKTFDVESIHTAFNSIEEENVQEIVDVWKEIVRDKTDFFKQADDFGIEIFTADIENQDKLFWKPKKMQIFFDPDPAIARNESWKNNPKYSIEGKPKYQGDLRLIGDGKTMYFYMKVRPNTVVTTPRNSKYIQFFEAQKPSLLEQFYFFMVTGELHQVVGFLVHELIHKSHQDKNPDIESEITEAQAYANNIVDPLGDFESTESLANHINQSYKEISLDKAKSAIENILFLYSQGYSTRKIAECFATFAPVIDGVWFLDEKFVKPILDKNNINAEEKKLIIDNYITKRRIDIQKARQVFFEAFEKYAAKNR